MTDLVTYQGKTLGQIKLNDNQTNKFVFIAKNLEALKTLFSINPIGEIRTEHRGIMLYEQFQKEYLTDISAFYSVIDA